MRIVAITQARTGSTRFPRKVLEKVAGQSLLELHLYRVLKSKRINELILATTINPEDTALSDIALRSKIEVHRGSETDVLDRFYQAVKDKKPDYIVRLTSDCPLLDSALMDKIIDYTILKNIDYCSNTLNPTYPDGQDVEVFRFSALEMAWLHATLDSEREHVTPYIWKNSTYNGGISFSSDNFAESRSFGHLRMTVDEPRDLEVIKSVIDHLGPDGTWLEYADFLEKSPEVRKLNQAISRNEGYTKSLKKDNN